MNSSPKAAIGSREYVLSANRICIRHDAVRHELRVFDDVCRVAYDAGDKKLALRQFDIAPELIFVLMTNITRLDGIGLAQHYLDNVTQRNIRRMRPVPAPPADVMANAVFWNTLERVI
jgi:hypothetical protein